MTSFRVDTEIDLDDLAEEVVSQSTHDEIMAFIMEIDERVADYDFSVKLRDRLIELIEHEDGADKLSTGQD